MKVRDLIELLDDCDPNGRVYLMIQPNYPFECAVQGVAQRHEFSEAEDAEAGEAEHPDWDRWSASERDLPGSDVFILQGGQLRYGATAAFQER